MHTYPVPYLSLYVFHSLFQIGSVCLHPIVKISFTWHSCHLHEIKQNDINGMQGFKAYHTNELKQS